MRRIGGSLGSPPCGEGGGTGEIPPFTDSVSNRAPSSGAGTAAGGQFDWGGRLLKRNGGAQRFPQAGWESAAEGISTRGVCWEPSLVREDRDGRTSGVAVVVPTAAPRSRRPAGISAESI